MTEGKDNERSGSSWRTIRQDVTARAMSKRGRQRQVFAWIRIAVLCVLVGLSTWGIYSIVHTWESDRAAIASAVKSEPVREIVVLTNGVLNRDWVARTLALPAQTTLMALDLVALREKLMAGGQISVAVLTRNFPDTLVVTLQERTPVARIQVADGLGAPRQLLVARDGVVYDGAGYDKAMVAGLPWLAGFSLRRGAEGGFEPIEGMDAVANLLTTAQLQAPHLYRDWLFVSLERLRDQREFVVKSQEIPEIVFSAREDYFRQLAQLDYIIDATKRQLGQPALQSVNLALGPQVPVKLAQTPDELARPVGQAAPAFNLQPSNPRRTNRDL
ncbi:MAG: cell division protein FtsQ [Opitutus sp.]|nr:cell division protein FtsQ [Opitutus sp.]